MARNKVQKTDLTSAQKKAIDYFKVLCEADKEKARQDLGRIIKLRADGGAKIAGKELALVYDKLGYYGAEEVSKTTFDFCSELTGMYKRLRQDQN